MGTPRRLLTALGIVIGVAVLAGLLFDSNWLKGPVERAVSERMGRDLQIGGDLDIVPRWPPRFVMERVRLANPPWAAEPDTLRLERVEFSLALLPLLRRQVVLPEVTLTNPVIDLERNAEGVDNWTLAPDPEQDDKGSAQARLESALLDLDDLGGFVGAEPQTGAGETASAGQQQRVRAAAANPRVLPNLPIKLGRLRAMDADVRFTGKGIRGRTPVDDLKTHLVLRDGVLTAQPLDFGVANGNVVSTLTLDGREPLAGVAADIEFRRLDLRKLFPGNSVIARATGLVGGRAKLQGRGNSLAELLADADGTLGLASSGGRISNLAVELAGLDVAEALKLLFRGDKTVRVRCAIADVTVRDGVIASRTVLIDTTDTNLKIDGQVSLASEELDITLHPLPKDYSPLSLRSPIHVRGTFKNPTIRPDAGLVVRGGIAAILAIVAAPVAALVGLIESGPGDNADCERLIAAVQRHVPEPGAAVPRPPSRPRS